jgi:hypothetical protein
MTDTCVLRGRSTIVNMIMRFYDPNKGAVLLDGIPLPDIDHVWLHSQVSIVSQEPVLFAESLFYNITFGMPPGKATLAQVRTPLQASDWGFHACVRGFVGVLLGFVGLDMCVHVGFAGVHRVFSVGMSVCMSVWVWCGK